MARTPTSLGGDDLLVGTISVGEATDDRVANLLVAGANISIVYNDTANTLTISSTGGGGGSATIAGATLSLPYAKCSHSAVVTDAAVSGTTKIVLTLGTLLDTDENSDDMVDLLSISTVPAAGSFTVRLLFASPFGGALKLNYLIG